MIYYRRLFRTSLLAAVLIFLKMGQIAAQAVAIEQIASDLGIPAIQIVHAQDGHLSCYNYGVKNSDTGDLIDRFTVFQAASLTKVIAAYTFFRLMDRGLIDLDTPLWQYYAYDRLKENPQRELITARMILTHRSGLLNWEGDVPSSAWRAAPLTLKFTPGTNYSYSGEGFYFLQETLEHITGKSFQELVEQEVLQPLGMQHSQIIWKDELEKNIAYGHYTLNQPRPLGRYRKVNAAYTLYTTAEDYTTFVQKGLNNGEGLRPETHRLMLSKASEARRDSIPSDDDKHVPCALGLRLQFNEVGRAVWHTGSNPGFRCFFISYPDTKESLAVFMNSDTALPAMERLMPLFIKTKQTFWAYRWRQGELD